MQSILQSVKKVIVQRIASSHLAGPDIADAVRVYHQALELGWSSTFGPWTDPTNTKSETAKCYLKALQAIIDNSLNCYLSVKLTAIEYDFALLKELLDLADKKNIRIHLDGMDPNSASPTLKIIEKALATNHNLGCTIASRWKRSIDDTKKIIEFGIPVRIVKGQWTDPQYPNLDPRENFLKIVDSLKGKVPLVAVATHDKRLAREALMRLKEANSLCEMEQLSSLPQNCDKLAHAFNVPMRIYIPFGYPSLPYNLRYVKARPMIVGWVIRDFFLGRRKHLAGSN